MGVEQLTVPKANIVTATTRYRKATLYVLASETARIVSLRGEVLLEAPVVGWTLADPAGPTWKVETGTDVWEVERATGCACGGTKVVPL